MPTVEEVIGKYISLRDRKAELAKAQAEQMKPLNEAMEHIENYFMHQLNTLGVDSFKTSAGTVFKSTQTSCQMQDALAFKEFVFHPAVKGIFNYLRSSGYEVRDVDFMTFSNILRDLTAWDMVDFRAGKKGITEYIENEKQPVPGVAVNTTATVNIRRA